MGYKFIAIASRHNHVNTLTPVVAKSNEREHKVLYLKLDRIYEPINRWYIQYNGEKNTKCAVLHSENRCLSENRYYSSFMNYIYAIILVFLIPLMFLYRPSVIFVVSEDTVPEKLIISAAITLKIPIIRIQEGIFNSSWCPKQVKADKFAVMGDFSSNQLIECGVLRDKIEITGQPRFDGLHKLKKNHNKKTMIEKLGLAGDKKIVVLATQPVNECENRALLCCVYNTIKEFPDIQLIVKPHPVELTDLHENLAKITSINNCIICHDNIHELLNVCDALITIHSTVALEAMLFGKPVITINLTGQKDRIAYAQEGAAIGIYSEDMLALALKNALYNDEVRNNLVHSQEKFSYEYAYKCDGNASKRIVELAEQLVSNMEDT